MIQNYKEYTSELKKIYAEKKIHSQRLRELNVQQEEIKKKLNTEAYNYLIEQFSQKLKRGTSSNNFDRYNKFNIDNRCFLLNDEIGIRVNPIFEYSTNIVVDIIYVKKLKGVLFGKTSDKNFMWEYSGGGITIDIFINNIMERLEKVYQYRKDAEMRRMAKKYNL